MANKVKFSSLAQEELLESSNWYESQSAGLGERFAAIVYVAADTISRNPKAFSKKRVKLREFVVDEFPYVIVYEYIETDDIINIVHVFHTSRNPKHKYKRK